MKDFSVHGLKGAGTVHHIAWIAKDEEDHQRWRALLQDKGYQPTDILDRHYFKAIYFPEEGGILLEITTVHLVFIVDEPINELVQHLMLPSWFE
ncbi:VOC family protein [Niallia sp. Krafla_26]